MADRTHQVHSHRETNLFKAIMNRFLAKKKGSAGGSPLEESSNPLSPPQRNPTKRWKKNKKDQTPQKPQLDFTIDLPHSDDFRTSLIMPNLSARFSMLREQDDPNSKLGKASDDSVLQPRRQSRLLDFGFPSNGLSDISEVASIAGSTRPPWLAKQHDSFVSDDEYGTDNDSSHNGSVMSRARPGEGNVLFGGRQKVYKVATGGVGLQRSQTSGLGKLVYEDDVSMSAFQKHRQQEKAAAALRGDDNASVADDALDTSVNSEEAPEVGNASQTEELQHSSPIKAPSQSGSASSYQRRPSIESFATSTPSQARSSTAATSIASQATHHSSAPGQTALAKEPAPAMPGLERSLTKRRLYEQGLDQHMYEQQASALTRLNSIQRQRTVTGTKSPPPPLAHTKSAGALDRSYHPHAMRPQSPPIVPPLTTFGSIRQPHPNGTGSGPQSPTYPPLNEYDEYGMLSSALQPGDRGKATAMGAFNKPKQQFDEQQYLQRQLQMQQARDIPSPDNGTLNEPYLPSSSFRSQAYRRRSQSSPAKPDTSQAFSVFQNAAAQIRQAQKESPTIGSTVPDTHQTFLGDISASEDDEVEENDNDSTLGSGRYGQNYQPNAHMMGSTSGRFTPSALPSVSEHPALRSQNNYFPEIEEEEEEEEEEEKAEEDDDLDEAQTGKPFSPAHATDDLRNDSPLIRDAPSLASAIPTLPIGANKDALKGLVHQHLRNTSDQSSVTSAAPRDTTNSAVHKHLRNQSNQSSIYPNTVYKEPNTSSLTDNARLTYTSTHRMDSSYANSNPWDLDDFDSAYYYGDRDSVSSPQSVRESLKPDVEPPNFASSKENINPNRTSLLDNASDSNIVSAPWAADLKSGHTRDASTATLQEREAFANELAARQRAIQQNLKGIVESQSRSSSPQPTVGGAFKAFNMLKPKSSRESMARQDTSTKAMKMLGLGFDAVGRSPSLASEDTRPGADKISQYPISQRPSVSREAQPSYDTRSRTLHPGQRPRGDSEASASGRQHSTDRSARTMQYGQQRPRSNSAVSVGRSQSRTGRYREDSERPVYEKMQSSERQNIQVSPMPAQHYSPQMSHEEYQHHLLSAGPRGGMGSDSRPNNPGYFDSNGGNPSSSAPRGRPSPAIGSTLPVQNVMYRPAQSASSRPSPIPSPYSSSATSVASGAITPMIHGPVTPYVPLGKPIGSVLRKRPVEKAKISEPTLISSTSNVDTVALPAGASLKNGMEDPSAVPATNPRRRRTGNIFGFGRDGASDERPTSPPTNTTSTPFGRVRSPEPWVEKGGQVRTFHAMTDDRPQPRVIRSPQGFETAVFPTMRPAGPIMTEGGMF